MIHFFDRVYLSYAEASVGAEAIERTSENFIQIVDKGLVYLENPIHTKKRLFYNQNVKNFLENFKTDEEFFQDLLNRLSSGDSKKIMIYVDEHAMLELLIRWWKALFPNITAKGIHALYVNFGDHQTIQNSHSRTYLDLTVNSKHISFEKFGHLYWDSSLEKIQGLFELYPAFEISEEVKAKCSVEFKMLNFLMEDRPAYLPSLIETMKSLYQKKVMDEITGIKRMIERSLFYMNDYFESNQLTLNGSSIQKVLQSNEALKFVMDLDIKNSKSSFEYLVKNYDLVKLSKALIGVDLYINRMANPNIEPQSLDNPCLTYFSEASAPIDYLDLLRQEMAGTSKLQLFKRMVQKKRMNPYLVPAFKNLLSQKSEFVSEFVFGTK